MAHSETDRICRQSGIIPYRYKSGKLEILLITSLSGKKWIIPKGIIEDGLSAKESAMKEAFEEAGIAGEIENKAIGSYSYPKWGMICNVEVYPCKVLNLAEKWPEKEERQRRWFPPKKALEKLSVKKLKQLMELFIEQYQVD